MPDRRRRSASGSGSGRYSLHDEDRSQFLPCPFDRPLHRSGIGEGGVKEGPAAARRHTTRPGEETGGPRALRRHQRGPLRGRVHEAVDPGDTGLRQRAGRRGRSHREGGQESPRDGRFGVAGGQVVGRRDHLREGREGPRRARPRTTSGRRPGRVVSRRWPRLCVGEGLRPVSGRRRGPDRRRGPRGPQAGRKPRAD